MASHIIHKQKVILKASKNEQDPAFQHRLVNLLRNELPGEMERLLDGLSQRDEVIRIESLQVDLGVLTAENFEAQFKKRLLEEMRQAIGHRKQGFASGLENKDIQSEATVLNPVQSLSEAFVYFLEQGRLPWYSAQKKMNALEGEMLSVFSAADWSALFQRLQKNERPVSVRRLVFQFSNAFLERLLAGDTKHRNVPWQVLLKELQVLLQRFSARTEEEARNNTWEYFLYTALYGENNKAVDGPTVSLEKKTAKFLLSHVPGEGIKSIESVREAVSATLETATAKAALNNLVRFAKRREARNESLPEKAGEESRMDQLRQSDDGTETGGTAADSEPATAEERGKMHTSFESGTANATGNAAADNGLCQNEKPFVKGLQKAMRPAPEVFVNNSGVIILHPFLEAYFEELNLWKEKQFVHAKARERAVLLLHYLATGETEAAEFDLALQKILCGFPLEDTLPNAIVISKKERDESEKLVQAVISHWPPLKNTSVEGLRTTFLQREGKLEGIEKGWRLTVEQKTVDILLAKLPWGFSTVRLPWMKGILNVEWA